MNRVGESGARGSLLACTSEVPWGSLSGVGDWRGKL